MDYLLYGGIFLGVVLVLFVIYRPKKGQSEDKNSHLLKELGQSDPDKDKYVLSDVMFHDGIRSAHIDHLLINTWGLHVILDIKQDGEIEGKSSDEKWIAHFKDYDDSFPNPIQVAKSLKLSIDKALKDDFPIFLYIVFPDKSDLNLKKMGIPVIKSYELNDSIKDNHKPGKPLTSKEIKHLYELFSNL